MLQSLTLKKPSNLPSSSNAQSVLKTYFVCAFDKGKNLTQSEPEMNKLKVLKILEPETSKSKVLIISEPKIQKLKVQIRPEPKVQKSIFLKNSELMTSKSKVLKKPELNTYGPKNTKGSKTKVKIYPRQIFINKKFGMSLDLFIRLRLKKKKLVRTNTRGTIRV